MVLSSSKIFIVLNEIDIECKAKDLITTSPKYTEPDNLDVDYAQDGKRDLENEIDNYKFGFRTNPILILYGCKVALFIVVYVVVILTLKSKSTDTINDQS